MSYSILYRSMFVKLSDGRFIPMMEMGDNNVWDCSYGGRARRSRSWSNINLNRGQKFFTHKEIVKALDTWYNECEQKRDRDRNSTEEFDRNAAENANFGFYEAIAVYGKGGTHGTTFNDVKNIILSGEKNCISFEEAIKNCGFHIYYWEKGENDITLTCPKYFNFQTEEEMFAFIKEKFGDKTNYFFVYNENHYTNDFYNKKKAIKNFGKLNGNREKFIVKCGETDTNEKWYIHLENNRLSLTSNADEATWFNKYESNGVRLFDMIINEFKEIRSMRYIYEKNLKKIA